MADIRLSTPTPREAEHWVRIVGECEGIIGTIMSPSSGNRPIKLRNIRLVEDWLVVRTEEDFKQASYRLDIHYMDLGALSEWLRDVIGDTELADVIADLNEDPRAWGQKTPDVKAALKMRIDQCLDLVEPGPHPQSNEEPAHAVSSDASEEE